MIYVFVDIIAYCLWQRLDLCSSRWRIVRFGDSIKSNVYIGGDVYVTWTFKMLYGLLMNGDGLGFFWLVSDGHSTQICCSTGRARDQKLLSTF